MTIESDLRAAADRATQDSQLLHQIVHGDALTTVTTEGGPVKSVAKAIADVEASVAAHMTELTQAVADAQAAESGAAAARDEAVAARDAALAAAGTVGVTAADANPGRLADKLEAGVGLEAEVVAAGSGERLRIRAASRIDAGASLMLALNFI